jgi:hypothetical protein
MNLRDLLTLQHNAGESTIQLNAGIKSRIKLIDPGDPRSTPVVLLRREDDSFFVQFSLFDSEIADVDHAEFEFTDSGGRAVPVDNPVISLREAVNTRGLIDGRSFTVIQEFRNAGQHPETRSVRVTVFGSRSGTRDSATGDLANPVQTGAQTRRIQDRAHKRAKLIRGRLGLSPIADRTLRRTQE